MGDFSDSGHSGSLHPIFAVFGVGALLLLGAAILFPVFAGGGRPHGGRHASCASNEKQIGLGIMQYVQDNDEMMPDISDAHGRNTWREVLYSYTKSKQLFKCPERKDYPLPDGFPLSYAANYSGNYGASHPDKGNGAFAGPGSPPVSFAGFKNPQSLIVLCEVDNSDQPEFNIDDAVKFGPAQKILWAGHQGMGVFLLADGHVRSFRPEQTYQVDTSGRVLNLWYRNDKAPLSANGVAVLKDAQTRFGE